MARASIKRDYGLHTGLVRGILVARRRRIGEPHDHSNVISHKIRPGNAGLGIAGPWEPKEEITQIASQPSMRSKCKRGSFSGISDTQASWAGVRCTPRPTEACV